MSNLLVALGMIAILGMVGVAVHFYYGKKEEEERRQKNAKS